MYGSDVNVNSTPIKLFDLELMKFGRKITFFVLTPKSTTINFYLETPIPKVPNFSPLFLIQFLQKKVSFFH